MKLGAMDIDSAPSSHQRAVRIARLRAFCLGEAFTLLILVGVAVPLKYLAGEGTAVKVMGPVHGLGFAAFVWQLLVSMSAGDIDARQGAKLLLAACIPLGGLVSWRRLR